MSTEQEPTVTVKLLQLLLLSTYWGMQIWVTFISSRYPGSSVQPQSGSSDENIVIFYVVMDINSISRTMTSFI